jgi:hypothetical protein
MFDDPGPPAHYAWFFNSHDGYVAGSASLQEALKYTRKPAWNKAVKWERSCIVVASLDRFSFQLLANLRLIAQFEKSGCLPVVLDRRGAEVFTLQQTAILLEERRRLEGLQEDVAPLPELMAQEEATNELRRRIEARNAEDKVAPPKS